MTEYFHCPTRHLHSAARNLLHVPRDIDSTRTAASGLLPPTVRPYGTAFRTLSAIRTPPKPLSDKGKVASWKTAKKTVNINDLMWMCYLVESDEQSSPPDAA